MRWLRRGRCRQCSRRMAPSGARWGWGVGEGAGAGRAGDAGGWSPYPHVARRCRRSQFTSKGAVGGMVQGMAEKEEAMGERMRRGGRGGGGGRGRRSRQGRGRRRGPRRRGRARRAVSGRSLGRLACVDRFRLRNQSVGNAPHAPPHSRLVPLLCGSPAARRRGTRGPPARAPPARALPPPPGRHARPGARPAP